MKNKLPKVFVGLSMIVITLVFSSSSCNRGLANFTLSGVISDATFSTGLSGAELKLSKVSITTGEETLMETKILGADGKFEFTFPREKIEKYILKVTKPLYFDIEEEIQFSSLTPSTNNIRNYSTKAKSWVEYRFVNNNPLPTDHLRITKFAGKENCNECCSSEPIDIYGSSFYAQTCINDALSVYSVYYQLVGTPTQDVLEVITQPFDTIVVQVNY
jgi:hypothetical protein